MKAAPCHQSAQENAACFCPRIQRLVDGHNALGLQEFRFGSEEGTLGSVQVSLLLIYDLA